MGDPKQEAAATQKQFLMTNQYTGPDPVSFSRNRQGQDMSTSFLGQSRPAGTTTNNYISAMDAGSFSTFLQKNSTALDQGVFRVIQNGSVSVPALAKALNIA